MPFNGSGTASPPNPPTFPAVSGQTIEAAKFNAIINDLYACLTQCVTKDGQTVITGELQWADAVANLAALGGVGLAGNQTIAGVKTFSSPPVIPDAVAANNPVSKAQLEASLPVAATTSISGTVKLATSAEAKAGTDTAKALTASGLSAAAIGGGWQTRQDVTASRALDATYLNDTGRMIFCLVSLSLPAPTGAGAGTYSITHSGVEVGRFSVGDANGSASGYEGKLITFPVLPGDDYGIFKVAGGTLSVVKWVEIR
jgi:hypothetical protein